VATSKYDLRKLYYDARKVMYERKYPVVLADGGYYDNDFPEINTTNGTQNYIQDVMNNLGHFAERINTQGVWTPDGWRRSGSTKGSPDVHCKIKIPSQALPVAWVIEVKKGADTLSPAQQKYRDNMARIGSLHSVVYVGNLDWFWDEYYRIIKL